MLSPTLSVSRRQALQTLGWGVAAVAVSRSFAWAEGTSVTGAGTGQPFTLPPLPYAYDALAPYFDARTMEIHHAKHHQAYITAANKALESRPDLRELSAEQLITRLEAFEEPLHTTLRNQVGGHLNHSFFWKILAAPTEYRAGPLRVALAKRFGPFENFQAEFARVATSRFGSGWAWLVVKEGELDVISTGNQDSPLAQGAQPIIGLDVWEHAYYLNYQNRRADYIQAFWSVLNWDAAEAAFAAGVTAI